MAGIQLGPIVSDITGSIGDVTYARGQGGLYVKARSGPGGVPTANQIAITDTNTALSQAWSGTLTESQRETWRTYASRFPSATRWGQRSIKNGYTRFIAVNFLKYVQSSAIAFPSAPLQPPFGPPAFVLTATTNPDTFSIPMPLLNEPDDEHILWVFTYIGTEQNVGRNFYATPWQFLSYDTRTLQAWSAAPLNIVSAPPSYTTAKKIWLKMRIQCSTCGNISTPSQASAIFDA